MSAAMSVRRPPGYWIPWLFVGGFLLVLAVNGTMIWLALTSWTGLATNQAYDNGLTYNRNLDAAARAAALGWRPAITVRIADGNGEIELRLTDRDGRPIAGAEVAVRFERPTSEGIDFALALAAVEPGLYRGRFALPVEGAWNLHATVRRGVDLLVRDQRVVLP